MTAIRTDGSGEDHPFLVAWRERDADAWGGALADDVVAHSPLLETPFTGRAT